MAQRNVDCLRRIRRTTSRRSGHITLARHTVEHRECRTMDESLMLVGEPSFAKRPMAG